MKPLLALTISALTVLFTLQAIPKPIINYYVARNEQGSSNSACDGSAPVNLGGGRCPFKDFSDPVVLSKISNVANVRMEVRGGYYDIRTPIILQGIGYSYDEAVTLAGYGNEMPVLDGGNITREVVRGSGNFVIIEQVHVQNAAAYNVEFRGVAHAKLRYSEIGPNLASDAVKGDGGASDVEIYENTFTGWASQAIDMAGVKDWKIWNNYVTDPANSNGKCFGFKFEAINVWIFHNEFNNCSGVAMGGVSSKHPLESTLRYEAVNGVVEGNKFTNQKGVVVDAYSCDGCRFQDNSVQTAVGGIRLSGLATQTASGCLNGCLPTRNFKALRNTLRSMVGNQNTPLANIFWIVDDGFGNCLEGEQNSQGRNSQG